MCTWSLRLLLWLATKTPNLRNSDSYLISIAAPDSLRVSGHCVCWGSRMWHRMLAQIAWVAAVDTFAHLASFIGRQLVQLVQVFFAFTQAQLLQKPNLLHLQHTIRIFSLYSNLAPKILLFEVFIKYSIYPMAMACNLSQRPKLRKAAFAVFVTSYM